MVVYTIKCYHCNEYTIYDKILEILTCNHCGKDIDMDKYHQIWGEIDKKRWENWGHSK